MDTGALVVLKCTGERLTVEYPLDSEYVMCGWWDASHDYHRAVFPVEDLRIILASKRE